MTRTEFISAPSSWTQCVFQRFFFISLRNFNQLDATSKVMYRHEIICTGNNAYLINNYLFRDIAVAASLWKFVNKANGLVSLLPWCSFLEETLLVPSIW